MNPVALPIARELFAQWQRARGARSEPATRPFGRDWEELLSAAGLDSATERNEAERDARALAADGWLDLKPVRYKAYLIAKVAIPLPAEARWGEAFGWVAPSGEELRCIREYPWGPALAFLRESPPNLPLADLALLNDFLMAAPAERVVIPIKERSLQIFGDEKRLDLLLGSTLFRPDRLDLERDLRCEVVGEPLPWRRGPAGSGGRPVIVLENAATWHTYSRWNARHGEFGAVVYGCGNRFLDGVSYLPDLFAELGGPRPVWYFGDLDPQGLRIPQAAASRAMAKALPPIEPHLWSYGQLLQLGAGREQPGDEAAPPAELCAWLGEHAEAARRLLAAGKRLAQERVGWEFLQTCPRPLGKPPEPPPTGTL